PGERGRAPATHSRQSGPPTRRLRTVSDRRPSLLDRSRGHTGARTADRRVVAARSQGSHRYADPLVCESVSLPRDERPVNVAVAGLGAWGPNLARNIAVAKGARLHTLCDAPPQRL